MLNLFKRQWLPAYVRDMLNSTFPSSVFKVEFRIDGKMVDLDDVKGNERHIDEGTVTYTDVNGDKTVARLMLYNGKVTAGTIRCANDTFMLLGIEPGVRELPTVGKPVDTEKYREKLKRKLSDAIGYCPGSFLDRNQQYPVTDMPRWGRGRLLNLLANMGTEGITAFVSFDLDDASLSQLEKFNDELELAMLVEDSPNPELIDAVDTVS